MKQGPLQRPSVVWLANKDNQWLLLWLGFLSVAFLIFALTAGRRDWLVPGDVVVLPIDRSERLSILSDGTVVDADWSSTGLDEYGFEARVFHQKTVGFAVEKRRLGSNEVHWIRQLLVPPAEIVTPVQQQENKDSRQEFRLAATVDGAMVAFSLSNRFVVCSLTNRATQPAPGSVLGTAGAIVDLDFLANGNLLVGYSNTVQLRGIRGETVASTSFQDEADALKNVFRLGSFAAVSLGSRDSYFTSKIRILDPRSLRVLGEFRATDDPYAVSGAGRLALFSGAGHIAVSSLAEEAKGSASVLTFLAPKETTALEFLGEDTVLAAGEGGTVYVCREKANPEVLLPSNPIRTNMVSYMAVAGEPGKRHHLLVRPKQATPYLTLIRVRSPRMIGSAVWAGLSLAALAWWRWRRWSREIPPVVSEPPTAVVPSAGASAPEIASTIPPAHVPEELLRSCRDGECVLYAGSGLSAQSGLPVWRGLLSEMVEWAIEQRVVDERLGQSLRAALLQGELESVSDGLLDQLGEQRSALYEFLQKRLLEGTSRSPVHQILRDLPFSAVLTTNLDGLLEAAFKERKTPVYTPRDTETLLTALSSRAFFILKLYGDLYSPGTVILSAAQYEDAIASNATFSTFMETLFFSRTILFLGASLEGIEDYLKGIRFSDTRLRTHYALVDVAGAGPTWELKSKTLRRKYGIEVIPYSPTEGHPQVSQFVGELAQGLEKAKGSDQTISGMAAVAAPTKGALKRVILDHIGPFDHLEMNLDPGWNILLGDNGVGKSNILKAIAVAFCGWDARAYANRLITVGADPGNPSSRGGTERSGGVERKDRGVGTVGTILLETNRGTVYRTELKGGSVEGEVISTPGRPLEAEGWLVIGFPPSRMFTWERSKGPEARVERRPTPEDLLPLIQGIPDPRMDKLKQWLVNLDYWIKDARVKNEDWQRFERWRKEFFEVIGKLTVGTKVEYGGFESRTFEVKVVTNDGPLPLEAISQGTAALLGWVGILLQRLHELPDSSTSPLDRYALVLIDELDAHMHPAWQQALVSLLKEIFPNIQFVVTTHSPFLAVGRRASEIVRLRRDPLTGRVVVETAEHDTTKMSVANVLTSYLFGLQSLLDYNLQHDLIRKRSLSVKPDLSEAERGDLASLSERLKDVDATAMIRDPLFQPFVEEMTRRRQEAGQGAVKLTKEEQERQRQLAREILDKLVREKEKSQ